jgi:hypothetical protein
VFVIPRDIEKVALLGWQLYPCSRTGKAGLWKGAQSEATSDLNILSRWSRDHPSCNWRVVFGRSGIWGLDVDSLETHACDGLASMAALVAANGPLPAGPRARSGGGGVLLFFRDPGGLAIVGSSEKLGEAWAGIDPKRGAQTQTIPPSVHTTTGRAYRWLTPPWEVSPPDAPEWLRTALRTPPPPAYVHREIGDQRGIDGHERLHRACRAIMEAREGQRNIVLNRRAYGVARMVGAGLLDERIAVDALYRVGRDIGLDHDEVRGTIHSALVAGRRKPTESR